jgi:hypothetical protein
VWNGLVHQSSHKARGGAIACALTAAATHAALPTFEADKLAISMLLELDMMEDHPASAAGAARLRAHVEAPPVLQPFSLESVKAWLGGALVRVLPVKRVSDEEYARMQELNPPMTIALHRCVTAPSWPAVSHRGLRPKRSFVHHACLRSPHHGREHTAMLVLPRTCHNQDHSVHHPRRCRCDQSKFACMQAAQGTADWGDTSQRGVTRTTMIRCFGGLLLHQGTLLQSGESLLPMTVFDPGTQAAPA